MANLNLSEFTEKTFVADADWVFVWDTVGAISKKVSRNSLLNSGTLATSAPVTISQTWNASGQTFKALVVNAAGTSNANSASGSLLLDLQTGGASQFEVDKTGKLRMGATGVNTHGTRTVPALRFASNNCGFYTNAPSGYLNFAGSGVSSLAFQPAGIMFSMGALLQWTSGVNDPLDSSTIELALLRDASNTLALRNGINPQTFNVYGTWSSITDYRRLSISVDQTTGNASILANKGSGTTGDVGTVSINGVPVGLGKGNVSTNVAVGFNTLAGNTTGSESAVFGFTALQGSSTGSFNSAFGSKTLRQNNSGSNNSAFGYAAIFSNTSGNGNSGVGEGALVANTTGSYNASVGLSSLSSSTTGSRNSAFGNDSGRFITGGVTLNVLCNNSIFIGDSTKAAADNQTNQIVIGYDATGLGSNSVVLGNASITTTALRGNVGIGTTAPSSKLHVVGDLTLPNGGSIFFGGAYNIYGTTSATTINGPTAFGQVAIVINGATKWVFNYDGLLCGGGTTASFPALKRTGAALEAKLADDSAYASFNAGIVGAVGYFSNASVVWRTGTGDPNGVYTAAVGSIFSRTDGGAGTSFYVKESGTGNTGWVAK